MKNSDPFAHNMNSTQMPADEKLGLVAINKRREYLLRLLNYDDDTVISIEQLENEFNVIVENKGI